MKRPTMIILIALCLPAAAFAQGMGSSLGHDLDALWDEGRNAYDLEDLDALRLLESRNVEIGPDGDLAVTVHRVVWIGTASGLRAHADLRIPWNSADGELTVERLRTWRDETWWPHPDDVSGTAVVETLPYALGRTPDYATMRETMLLHDGVELPCILETAYTITRRGAAVDGADDLFVMAQDDPAVRVEYILRAPGGPSHVASRNGAPEPRQAGEMLVWTMDRVAALKRPHTVGADLYEPCLAWSTWADWAAVRDHLTAAMPTGEDVGEALREALDEALEDARSARSRFRAILGLVDQDVRHVHYPSHHWSAPRTPDRIWDTAYAIDLDLAALVIALSSRAGFMAELIPSSTHPLVDSGVPAASMLDAPLVWIHSKALDGTGIWFDPSLNQVVNNGLSGRVRLHPEMDAPDTPRHERSPAEFSMEIHLEPGNEDEWTGRGSFSGRGDLSPFDRMSGLDDEALTGLNGLLRPLSGDVTIDGHNPEIFQVGWVDHGFALSLAPEDTDALDRSRLGYGDLPGGVLDHLPRNVRLEQATRESPVFLRSELKQSVSLVIEVGDHEVVGLPEPKEIENPVGVFRLTVERDEDSVTIGRTLAITQSLITTDEWPDLRRLLLEEQDAANRYIYLK